ncbi:unnamed protein product [Rotaria sordida]|uniref:Uncharacterized protein n=1 Tax=Rotaria sordida TaxID=392033 RepID=A0A814YC88_9BILA|nr:unnamed protein product [Rotaria sordida]CAF3722547.1 unnamed protein product [Rotaria sordida]
MFQFKRFINNKLSYCFVYTIGICIAISLAITIALLIWYLLTPAYVNYNINQTNFICPPNPCSSTTRTTTSSISSTLFDSLIASSMSTTSISTMQTSISTITSSSTKPNISTKRTYKESCDQLYDCYIEYGLLCEYGWNENKSCLCEGSHYWSVQQNKCLRKGEINDSCDIDHQCHREIGLVCDKPPGQTTVQRIVDCINENYATTCLVLGTNNIYHMVTVRSISEKELSFDWFLIDNRILEELPQLSCTFNNDTKYCFGLSTQDSQHSLKLAQFTRKGFHSIENIGGTNRGIAFGLTNINNVSVYVRNSQNILYRRIIVDDEILSAHNIALSSSGDPMCYIYEVLISREIYCFARNSVYGLTEYVELSKDTWRTTQLGIPTDRIRDEIAPVCSYVGQIHRYCFAIFENGQIYRIISKSGVWSKWQSIGRERQYQFISQPAFIISKPLNQSSSDQTCYLLAIDTNNNLQLSTNLNCALVDNFSEWISISTNLKFKQFNKTFRLRDGNIGVLGIDSQNRPYYIYLDPKTNRFTSPRPAFTVKSVQFRP